LVNQRNHDGTKSVRSNHNACLAETVVADDGLFATDSCGGKSDCDSAGSSPFASYLISVAGAGPDYAADDNSGGTFVQIVSSVTPASDAGATIDLAMVFNSSAVKLYRNGTSIASISNGNNNPTYGATSQLGFGDIQVLSRNPNAELVFGYIFAADMSASLATIRASPYALFKEGGVNAGFFSSV
jgi:hypothetical protein